MKIQGKGASDAHGRLNQTCLLVLEGLLWSLDQQWLATGTRSLAAESRKVPLDVTVPETPRFQSWVSLGQITIRKGYNPTHYQIIGIKLN